MTRWIIGSSLTARRVVLVITGALLVAGVLQLRSTQVDSLPEFTPPTVQIQTEALGLSAPEVEQLITVPLEQDLFAGLPWLDTMRSESIPGLSSIELIFEPGTDILRARQVVQERLTQAAGLPNVSQPPQMLQPLASTSRIMMVRLSSKVVTPIEMSVLARWTVRPRLLGVPGVANVSIWGQKERQLQVQVDPHRLAAHGLSLDEVIETSGNALWASPLTFLEASTPGTGGFIDTPNQRLSIQHLQPITTAANLAKVPIQGEGKAFRLEDIAKVVESHQPLIGDAVFTDGDPGLLLVVEKFPGTNTLEVTRGVEAALDALKPGLSGIDVDPAMYRPASHIERSLGNFVTALVIGFLLLVLVLGAFLFSWRSALVALVAILASIAAASLVLYLRGTTINTILLAGLVMALAIVIDDALVGADSARHSGRDSNQVVERSAAGSILETALRARSALAYGTLIALIAVLPLFFLQGPAVPFIFSIILSYGLAVVASMLVALIVTPALGLVLLSGTSGEPRESPVVRWFRRGYDRLLAGALSAPRRVFAGAALLVVAGLVALPFLSQTPLPSFRDGYLLIDWNAQPGTSLPEMDRITTRVGHELASLPGVLEVGAHVGRAITSDQVVGVGSSQLWVTMDPEADYEATAASIRRIVDGYPGIDHTVRTYSDERISNVRSLNAEAPIIVRLFGQDLDVLRSKGSEVMRAIAGIDGIVNPSMQSQPREPTVSVAVDLRKADHYGVVPGDVRRSAATFLSGIGVGSLFEHQKVFDVVVWGTPSTRSSLNDIRSLLIDTPGGGHVPLGRVADITIAPTPTVIEHRDISRNIDVTAGVQGRDVASVAADVQRRLRTIRFPLENHAELVGDYAERQSSHLRALAVTVAAAIGIFLLLQAAFASWRLATIAFLTLPLALVGGVLAVLLGGDRTVSIGSVAGFFAVLGISVRSGIMLIRHYRHLELDDGGSFGQELVHRGSQDRFLPILTSAVAVSVALLPMALSGNAAGQEVVRPMALVIIGGLVTSTMLLLLVVPNLYLRFGSAATRASARREAIITLPEAEQVTGS